MCITLPIQRKLPAQFLWCNLTYQEKPKLFVLHWIFVCTEHVVNTRKLDLSQLKNYALAICWVKFNLDLISDAL